MNTIMFSEALQDLKDRYPARLTLIHLLSRQAQEVPLQQGRLDYGKAAELLRVLVPAAGIDEAFVCGPEGMIEGVHRALLNAGVAPERVHTERFFAAGSAIAIRSIATRAQPERATAQKYSKVALAVVLDGKTHELAMGEQDRVLDVALDAGLDLPYSCRGGVCCTCRARAGGGGGDGKELHPGALEMERGFVLTCQARPLSARVVVSYDER